ncbi:MAG: glycosyltransferase family 9 protein [Gammaproteobacteria bacterium]
MASPMIESLRAKHPDAYIAWLVQPEAGELLDQHAGLNEVIVWPRGEWRLLWRKKKLFKLLKAIITFSKTLRVRKYDLVIDAQGLLKSGLLAKLSKAHVRIGLGSKEGSSLLMTRVIDKPKGDKRIGSEYRYLAEQLGLDLQEFSMHVALAQEDLDFANEIINRENLNSGYSILCPFTTRPQKHWVQDNWVAVAERLWQERSLRSVVLGGPADKDTAKSMVAGHEEFLINLTGKTGLRQASALINRAGLLIGVDTGLTHVGTAFRIPTIAIFGSTCPYLDAGSEKTHIIYKALECSPCRRNPTCGGAYTCLTSITVDEVVSNASSLLGC